MAATDSCAETSTCSPRPLVIRAKRAASDADGGVQRRLVAGLVAERLERRELGMRPARRSASATPPALQVTRSGPPVVCVRPGEAEGRDRGHHEPRVQRGEAPPVEPVRGHRRRVHVVDEQVGAGDEAIEAPRARAGA